MADETLFEIPNSADAMDMDAPLPAPTAPTPTVEFINKKTGNLIPVPIDSAVEALNAPNIGVGPEYHMVKDGREVTIRGEGLRKFLELGWNFQTQENAAVSAEKSAAEAQFPGLGGKISSALVGAYQMIPGGAGFLAGDKYESPLQSGPGQGPQMFSHTEQKQALLANPKSAMAGKIGTGIATSLPAVSVGGPVIGAASVVAGARALALKALAGSALGSAEGAVSGVIQASNQAALEDPEHASELMWAGAAKDGALFGAIGGGVVGPLLGSVAVPLMGKAASKVSGKISQVAESLPFGRIRTDKKMVETVGEFLGGSRGAEDLSELYTKNPQGAVAVAKELLTLGNFKGTPLFSKKAAKTLEEDTLTEAQMWQKATRESRRAASGSSIKNSMELYTDKLFDVAHRSKRSGIADTSTWTQRFLMAARVNPKGVVEDTLAGIGIDIIPEFLSTGEASFDPMTMFSGAVMAHFSRALRAANKKPSTQMLMDAADYLRKKHGWEVAPFESADKIIDRKNTEYAAKVLQESIDKTEKSINEFIEKTRAASVKKSPKSKLDDFGFPEDLPRGPASPGRRDTYGKSGDKPKGNLQEAAENSVARAKRFAQQAKEAAEEAGPLELTGKLDLALLKAQAEAADKAAQKIIQQSPPPLPKASDKLPFSKTERMQAYTQKERLAILSKHRQNSSSLAAAVENLWIPTYSDIWHDFHALDKVGRAASLGSEEALSAFEKLGDVAKLQKLVTMSDKRLGNSWAVGAGTKLATNAEDAYNQLWGNGIDDVRRLQLISEVLGITDDMVQKAGEQLPPWAIDLRKRGLVSEKLGLLDKEVDDLVKIPDDDFHVGRPPRTKLEKARKVVLDKLAEGREFGRQMFEVVDDAVRNNKRWADEDELYTRSIARRAGYEQGDFDAGIEDNLADEVATGMRQTLSTITKAAQDASLKKASFAVGAAAGVVGGLATLNYITGEKDDKAAINKAKEMFDPKNIENVQEYIGRIAGDDDAYANALGTQYARISSVILDTPTPTSAYPGVVKVDTAPEAMRSYKRKVAAAINPISVLSNVAKLGITPEELDVIKRIYPKTLYQFRTAVLAHAQNEGLSIDAQRRLQPLFDTPFSAQLSPQSLAATQEAHSGPQMPVTPHKLTGKKLENMQKAMPSSSQFRDELAE
jgi:hypothetical protein